ncbi:MAG: DUF4833 domain-containing protein [Bacteroidia bacterium]|nr:DUF4833 domain-containing protein [Bacteroidia bacterium]MCZ2277781.1 DUF4833 domain-containing protein [Bacteroidia bacterium]
MIRLLLVLTILHIPLLLFSQKKSLAELNKEVDRIVSRFPVPKEKHQLFYLQRNKNSNAVVYQANLLANGKFDPKNPVSVYWLRFNEDSSKKELNWIQRWLAYGIDFRPATDGSGNFILSPVALKHRKILLSFDEKSQPVAIMKMNGKNSYLKRIFAQAEETSWLPTVKYVQLKGEDLISHENKFEYIFPKDNKVPESQ